MTSYADEQRERREVLNNDRLVRQRQGDTFHSRAVADAAMELGGRFASIAKPIVTGGGPSYPTLPAASPWHKDPVPDEPPLGYSIEELFVEPLSQVPDFEQPLGPPSPVVVAPDDLGPLLEVVRSSSSSFRRRF